MTAASEAPAPLRIVELQAENVKRLKAVRITPVGRLTRIEGKNGAGKSSVIDTIAWLLAGAQAEPTEVVRRGTQRASARLDLGELVIQRTKTAAGTPSLTVTAKDGSVIKSPQAVLDKLFGNLTFDPLAFIRMKPAEQGAELRRLTGLDFSALDRERDQKYTERTMVNRDLKAAQARVGPIQNYPKDLPEQELSAAELLTEAQRAAEHNAQIDRDQRAVEDAVRLLAEQEDRIVALERELASLRQAQKNNAAWIENERTRLAGVARMDADAIRARCQSIESTNQLIRHRNHRAEAQRVVDEISAKADALTARIEAIDADRSQRIAAAKFPVPGLSIGPEGVTLDGIPFSQASSSQQLRASVAIGLAQNPRLRVALVREGSFLDKDAMADLERILDEFDAQAFVERVADEAQPGAVVIEDGEVVAEPEPAQVGAGK